MRTRCALLASALPLLFAGLPRAEAEFQYRLYMEYRNPSSTTVNAMVADMHRAASAGYTAVFFHHSRLNSYDLLPAGERASYEASVTTLRNAAAQYGLDVYVGVYSFGLLAHDRNLAEGIPVREAPFVVAADRTADINSSNIVNNAGFESWDGVRFTGWDAWTDKLPFIVPDSACVEGTQSCKITVNTAINQAVTLTPFRQYRVSFWAKADDSLTLRSSATTGSPSFYLYEKEVPLTNGGWQRFEYTLNSMAQTSATLYFGRTVGTGNLWIDGIEVKEAGLINVLDRAECPVVVTDVTGNTQYFENQDFEHIHDSTMEGTWGTYLPHTPPKIVLTANSRIQADQQLKVSYYAPIPVGVFVYPCLAHPGMQDLLADQIERLNTLYAPKGFFMNHDEIRTAGWCELCRAKRDAAGNLDPNGTPWSAGQLLGLNVQQCVNTIKNVKADADLLVWSDMFAPCHNAKNHYYLTNNVTLDGYTFNGFENSWLGLPDSNADGIGDIPIVNWLANENGFASVLWFDKQASTCDPRQPPPLPPLKHRQILSGTETDPSLIGTRLAQASQANVDILGVMYATWDADYSQLETFADYAGFVRITSQPVSQTLWQWDVLTLTVGATGPAPLTYQWYKNGQAIPGAQSSEYIVEGATENTPGSYTVRVSNANSAVTSDPAVVKVYAWRQVNVTGPSARTRHAMCFDSSRSTVILFGGEDANGPKSDTWEYDGMTWRQVTATGTPPEARRAHVMSYYPGVSPDPGFGLLFGGQKRVCNPRCGWPRLGDTWTWTWSGNDIQWNQVHESSDVAPRSRASMVYDPSYGGLFMLFGGETATGPNSERWYYDPIYAGDWMTWDSDYINPRYGQAAAYVGGLNSETLLFGGTDGTVVFNDTWLVSADWGWTLQDNGPTGRHGHALAYDTANGFAAMFGGNTGSAFSDENWIWTRAGWQQAPAYTPEPSARMDHALVYDASRGVIVLFGGQTASGFSNETWELKLLQP